MHPVVALTAAEVEMDVHGLTYDRYPDDVREAVIATFPRPPRFKENITQAFYDGIRQKPGTTFGNIGTGEIGRDLVNRRLEEIADVAAIVRFYEPLTGLTADWLASAFCRGRHDGRNDLDLGAETVALFREGSAEPAATRNSGWRTSAPLFARLKDAVVVAQALKTLLWGNRVAQFRDAEGTLVSLFTPVTDAA